MSSSIVHLKITPKRMLTRAEAATHCGIPEKQFPKHCPVQPHDMGSGKLCYDVHDLDSWIDHIKGGDPSGSDDELLSKLG